MRWPIARGRRGLERLISGRVVVIAISVGASGQSDPEGGVVFELSSSNPEARSMGFGGAFAALAGDAAAACATER